MIKKITPRRLIIFLLAVITGGLIAAWIYLAGTKPSPQPLQLINRSPKIAQFEAANTTAPIFLYFDRPIDPASAIIESNPDSTRLTAAVRPDQPTMLVLTPNAPWQTDQTITITVKKSLVSSDKKSRLPADITFQLLIKSLPRPSFDRPI